MPTDEDRWAAWCSDFDDVYNEVVGLFHLRWMWRAITGLMNNGVPEKQYKIVQDYFIGTYVQTMCTAIRREVDQDARTSSLARCLHALVECPHFVTRDRYVQAARQLRDENGGVLTDSELECGFDRFACGTDGAYLNPQVATDALARLAQAAMTVRRYTNKVLAHRERGAKTAGRLNLTFDDINGALEEVGRVTQLFYELRPRMWCSIRPLSSVASRCETATA